MNWFRSPIFDLLFLGFVYSLTINLCQLIAIGRPYNLTAAVGVLPFSATYKLILLALYIAGRRRIRKGELESCSWPNMDVHLRT